MPEPASRERRAASSGGAPDASYLMFDPDATEGPSNVLANLVRRMTIDQLVFSGGKSDPETGTYWLAYRQENDETPPF
jgi:hypothetical protein